MPRRVIDTTIRGLVYESCGTVDGAMLRGGAEVKRQSGALQAAQIAQWARQA